MIRAAAPDAVILATGATPSKLSFIPGADKAQVFDCVTALVNKGKDDFGQKVVVIGGGHVGCEVAMELAVNKGKDVAIVEMAEEILKAVPPVPTPIKMYLTDMCDYYHVDVHTGCAVQEIRDDCVVVKNAAGETEQISCDNVVLAAGFKANPSMASELNECGIAVYELGNGKPSANVLQSTAEAYEIVNNL
jgi:2-enoate reductase